jgi:FtsH-binding integral membrane protein
MGRVLLVVVAVLLGIITALVTVMVATRGGAKVPAAVGLAACAFAATVYLVLELEDALGLLAT